MNPYLTQRANRRWWVYPLMGDLLHVGELRTAEVEGLAVQRQHFGAQVIKLFDH